MCERGYILLTGAGGGLGTALLDDLLTRGYENIVCQYRRRNEQLFGVYRKHGLQPENHCFPAELTDENAVSGLRMWANERFGTIWGLLNLAGGSSNGMSWKLSVSEFMDIINANLTSTFICSKIFIPDLRAAKGGRIINFSSVVGFSGVAGASAYCAAKAGLVGFTKSVALELASSDITVNALALGYFNYGLINSVPSSLQEEIVGRTPLKRFGQANELGGMVSYLLSEDAAFTTGQVIHINGGIF